MVARTRIDAGVAWSGNGTGTTVAVGAESLTALGVAASEATCGTADAVGAEARNVAGVAMSSFAPWAEASGT